MNPITAFRAEHAWLSNMWPTTVHYDGLDFPSVEHAYQAAKSPLPTVRERIRDLPSAAKAKRYGRNLPLTRDWHARKVAIMRELLTRKFSDHEDLRAKLLATHDTTLIEGNDWHDHFWGVADGYGLNTLGKLLMDLRADLLREETERLDTA